MDKLIKVKNIYTKEIVYFRWFGKGEFHDCFYYTETEEATGFGIGFIKNYEPIRKTWQEVINETS